MSVSDPPLMTCYLHPERWTGVTCQRCSRPICPSCMRQASVGYHCPECVREAAAQSPHYVGMRSVQRGSAPVTTALVAINVAVFIISIVMDREVAATGFRGRFTFDWGLYPPLVGDGEWWRLVTGGFLHAGALHLGMNMFVLYTIGSSLEPAIGKLRFLTAYAVSLIGGALGVVLLFERGQGLTVGASGAIFGLFGVLVVYQLARGQNPFQSGLGTIIILNLVFTFALPGISVGGHVGGLVSGAIVGAVLFAGSDPRRQAPLERVGRTVAAGLLGVSMFLLSLAEAHAILLG